VGGDPQAGARGVDSGVPLSTFLDTNVLIRHLTGDPPDQARRATAWLAKADELLLTDVVFAECVYVLASNYQAPREQIASLMGAALRLPSLACLSVNLLLRALELYERQGVGFADAYLIASAELSGVGSIVSFDKELARHSPVSVVSP
jgi:predicted nucleic acid-binding protein